MKRIASVKNYGIKTIASRRSYKLLKISQDPGTTAKTPERSDYRERMDLERNPWNLSPEQLEEYESSRSWEDQNTPEQFPTAFAPDYSEASMDAFLAGRTMNAEGKPAVIDWKGSVYRNAEQRKDILANPQFVSEIRSAMSSLNIPFEQAAQTEQVARMGPGETQPAKKPISKTQRRLAFIKGQEARYLRQANSEIAQGLKQSNYQLWMDLSRQDSDIPFVIFALTGRVGGPTMNLSIANTREDSKAYGGTSDQANAFRTLIISFQSREGISPTDALFGGKTMASVISKGKAAPDPVDREAIRQRRLEEERRREEELRGQGRDDLRREQEQEAIEARRREIQERKRREEEEQRRRDSYNPLSGRFDPFGD